MGYVHPRQRNEDDLRRAIARAIEDESLGYEAFVEAMVGAAKKYARVEAHEDERTRMSNAFPGPW